MHILVSISLDDVMTNPYITTPPNGNLSTFLSQVVIYQAAASQ